MGDHLYYFYEDDEKLAKILANFFMEGLRKGEYCVWISREDITHDKAIKLLEKHIPDIEDYMLKDQMYIESFSTWGLAEGRKFDKDRLVNKWMDKYKEAMSRGFTTMRAAGDPSSILAEHWDEFMSMESEINNNINDLNLVVVCTYKGQPYKPTQIHTILRHHCCPLTPSP